MLLTPLQWVLVGLAAAARRAGGLGARQEGIVLRGEEEFV